MTALLDPPSRGRPSPRTRFHVPVGLSATAPPEERDGVRLLVAEPRIRHVRFRDLADVLTAGDLLVVNASATLPAAVDGTRASGRPVAVHFAGPAGASDGAWVVELRVLDDDLARVRDAVRGERIQLPGDVAISLDTALPDGHVDVGSRLWRARLVPERDVAAYLAAVGRPIRYGYVDREWPLEAYQTVFATEPGSAEMPSAGRPFTGELVARLAARGVLLAPVVLHTAVSSLEAHELPLPERYAVPRVTARLVEHVRATGGRVIGVGTTAVRALESATDADGSVHARSGVTDLVLGPDRPPRVVDGLLTGWHEPDASHLLLLEAVAGPQLVDAAYGEALACAYRWHEFGDACLLLPARVGQAAHG